MTPSTLRKILATATSVALLATGAMAGSPPVGALTGHPPGLVGHPIVLANPVDLINYDVAANSAGRAYIGWISNESPRHVNLCTLPLNATGCLGGVQTIDAASTALDASSASGLRVLVTGNDVVKLIWFHDVNVPSQQGKIAVATAVHGANLSAEQDVATVPPFPASLLDAEVGPNGQIWTVVYLGLPGTTLQVRPGFGQAATTAHAPFGVGFAQLAFTGGKAVLAVEKYGSISTPARYAVKPSTSGWSSFHTVANTWTGAGATLETAPGHGMRIVTGVNNASYRPVIAKWTGSGFAPRQLTVDNNSCGPSTHDGSTDPSGRLLDVSWECSKVTIANYADAFHAAIFRISVGQQVPTFAPQIASGTRGIATVVWSVEAQTTGNVLRVAHVRLPDSTVTVTGRATGGRVTVTGPRSCLPPVNVHVGWTHPAATNWSFRSGSFRLGTQAVIGSTLDGASLAPGRTYKLIGVATFGRGTARSTAKATLPFTTCGTG